ncbi:hypothetical protein C8R47DRAFT_4190 [Mycena vitilis]|nr:hypothetical protein C8R47DRAFT_4190 [Mycena vitilis]
MDASVQTDDEVVSNSTRENDGLDSSGVFSSESDGDYTDDGLASQATLDNAGPSSTGMFSESQHITVTAGSLTNITKIYNGHSTPLSDFRNIRLGDIDLGEIRLDNASGLTWRHRRRVHSARVEGRQFTVAIYQGDGAEEEWQKDITLYTYLRHPNFVQLWGITTSSRIHAAIFHDDLILFQYFLDLHRDRPVLTVYILAICGTEYLNLGPYFYSVFKNLVSFTRTVPEPSSVNDHRTTLTAHSGSVAPLAGFAWTR